jgi:pilus assembly protein Flp/PilA
MKQFITTLWQDESGQDLAEYALLLALIAVVLVAAIAGLQAAIGGRFTAATTELNAAGN